MYNALGLVSCSVNLVVSVIFELTSVQYVSQTFSLDIFQATPACSFDSMQIREVILIRTYTDSRVLAGVGATVS